MQSQTLLNNEQNRVKAIEYLAIYALQSGSEQAITPLVALLKASGLDVRVSATQLLGSFVGHLNIHSAEKPLMELLISEHKELRFHSSLTLTLIKLKHGASNSPDNLAQQLDQEAKLLLEQFHTLEKDEQREALSALSRIPSQLILNELLQQEEQSKDHETRTAALHALGQSLAKQGSVQVLQRLQTVADDQQEALKIRINAVKALGYRPVDATLEFLIKLVKGEPRLINAIYVALDRLNSPKSLAFLQESLSKQELETWLARQIARLDETEVFKLLRHNLYSVRKGAWLGISQQYSAKNGWNIDGTAHS